MVSRCKKSDQFNLEKYLLDQQLGKDCENCEHQERLRKTYNATDTAVQNYNDCSPKNGVTCSIQIFILGLRMHVLLVVHAIRGGAVAHLIMSNKSGIQLDADQAMVAHCERELVELVGDKIIQVDQVQAAAHMRLFQHTRGPVVGNRRSEHGWLVHGGIRTVRLADRTGEQDLSWRIRLFLVWRFHERPAGGWVVGRAGSLVFSGLFAAGQAASGANQAERLFDL